MVSENNIIKERIIENHPYNIMDIEEEKESWKVLIVDDDEDVHLMTKVILKRFKNANIVIDVEQAYSAKEALEIMSRDNDIALILLDIAMEEEDSGLETARIIREVIGNKLVRIIMRTGYDTFSVEEIVTNYDVDGFCSKGDVTVQKLYTMVVSALRAYKGLIELERNRIGLEFVIESAKEMFMAESVDEFLNVAFSNMIALGEMSNRKDYPMSAFITDGQIGENVILYGQGEYADDIGRITDVKRTKKYFSLFKKKVKGLQVKFGDDYGVCMLYHPGQFENYFVIIGMDGQDHLQKNLLETYFSNVALAFENVFLANEIIDAQKEVIITLGEIVETRSKETAYHVRRVAEYSYLLALELGLDQEYAQLFKMASPMHDIGKIGIKDSILNKKGLYTREERAVMEQHCLIGYEILKHSNRELFKIASLIAYEHHERWDGMGYPEGKMENEIHIVSRITTLADIFDALSQKRIYKEPWEMSRVKQYIRNESGKTFDPHLVKLFFENFEKVMAIMNRFKD